MGLRKPQYPGIGDGMVGDDGDVGFRPYIDVTTDLDLSVDGITTSAIYCADPSGGTITITLPDPIPATQNVYASFVLCQPSVLVVETAGPSTIGGQTEQIITTVDTGFSILDNGTNYILYQDSRPKPQAIGLVFRALEDANIDIPAYRGMVQEVDGPVSPTEIILTPVVVGGQGVLIDVWTTEDNLFLGDIPQGILTFWARVRDGAKKIRLYMEVYKRDGVGTETLLATSEITRIVDDTLGNYPMDMTLPQVTTMALTDRLVFKLYGNKIGTGGDPSAEVAVEGANALTRAVLPVPITTVAHNALPAIQGGIPGEYYHLTQGQHDNLGGGAGSLLNRIINGDFGSWQREISFVDISADEYTSDRWKVSIADYQPTVERQDFTSTAEINNQPEHYFRISDNFLSPISSSYCLLLQRIEDVRLLEDKEIVLSFDAKANATSSLSCSFSQYFGSGGSSTIAGIGATVVPLTTSWNRFEVPVTIPSINGKTITSDHYLQLDFFLAAGSDFDARTGFSGGYMPTAFTIDIANVQVAEKGLSTAFSRRLPSAERLLCDRYYQKTYTSGFPGAVGAFGDIIGVGQNTDWASTFANIPFIVRMRIDPDVVIYNPSNGDEDSIRNQTDGVNVAGPFNLRISDKSFALSGLGKLLAAKEYRLHYTADAEL